MSWTIPTIAAIQRTNMILVAATAIALELLASTGAAFGCVLGGAIVIANLYVLSTLGRLVLAASGGGAMAHRAGIMAIPLKLLLIAVLVYLLFTRAHVDALGFGAGVLTQLLAILIETGRAATRQAASAG